tara:strand:+ start:26 stop:559 length:534 start_codon:yes stop_codon:yes gene_type:complete
MSKALNIKEKIVLFVEDNNLDLKNVSLAIGRNHAYLHQFINRGIPRKLPEEAREKLAIILGIHPDELKEKTESPDLKGLFEKGVGEFIHSNYPANYDKQKLSAADKKQISLQQKLHKKVYPIAKAALEEKWGTHSLFHDDSKINDLTWEMVEIATNMELSDEQINIQLAEWVMTWIR